MRAARGLENAAAFVYVKDRPWSKVRELLAAGLDVRLQKIGTGQASSGRETWEMVRDPQVSARERRWRAQLTANLYEQMQERLRQHAAAEALGRAHGEEELERRWRRVIADQSAAERSGKPEDRRRAAELAESMIVLMYAREYTRPSPRLALAWERAAVPALPGDLVQPRWLARTGPASALPPELLNPVLATKDPVFPEAARDHDAFFGSFSLERSDRLTLKPELCLLSPTGRSIYLSPEAGAEVPPPPWGDTLRPPLAEAAFAGVSSDEFAWRVRGLGPEALQWLRAEQEATRTFLLSKRASTPFQSRSVLPLDALSQLVEAWSRGLSAEAVMELAPGAEGIASVLGDTSRSPTGCTFTFRQVWEKLEDWTLREVDGVLLVRNPLAFVDRTREYPLTAFLPLERRVTAGIPAGAPVPDEPPVRRRTGDELSQYYRVVAARPELNWTFPPEDRPFYRGVHVRELDEGLVPFLLWKRIGPVARRALLERSAGSVQYPLAAVDALTLDRCVAVLRSMGSAWRLSWHPTYPNRLGAGALGLAWSRAADGKSLAVTCHLDTLNPASGKRGDLAARFTWAP